MRLTLKRAYGTDVKGGAAAESDGGKRYSITSDGKVSETASDDTSSIKEQLRNSLDTVNALESVASVEYSPTNKKELKDRAISEFRKIGFIVDRQNFGKIEIGEKQITNSLNYLNTEAEKAALLTVPKVLKRGEIISGHKDHKGRAYSTITIAAPVEINGIRGNVAATVRQTGASRYYTHRILLPNGSEFIFAESRKNEEPTFVGMPATNDSQRSTISSSSVDSISQDSRNVNRKFSEISDAKAVENVEVEATELSDSGIRYSLRKEDPPKKTLTGYKVFVVKNGKLYPPMVANPNAADTPVGVWLNADIGVQAPDSKTGRKQVKAGGKGTQGGSLAFRPGWHLGETPLATQFDRTNPETGKRELFPENFVWAECEIAADKDYQEEAMSYGYTKSGKFQHSLAELPKLPVDGYYKYRTNPNPDTVPWLITGAMKVNRLLDDAEVNRILESKGLPPKNRVGGNKTLADLGLEETAERLNEVSKPEKRFSLSSNVEQTKDLIAVHNMTAAELEKSLDLGGLPMPSIAIIKAADGHLEYGDVSLVFGKDTIDPKKSARNKVYGGDAWTPTFPKIEYKANEKVGKRIRDKYYDLSRKNGYDNTRALYNYAQDLSDVLTSEGGEKAMIDKLYGDTGMMQIYLMDTGRGRVANVNKETKTALTDGQVRQYEILIDTLGRDGMNGFARKDGEEFADLVRRRKAFIEENEAGIRKAFEKTFIESGMSAKDASEVSAELALSDLRKYVLDTFNYIKNGAETVKTEFDAKATDAAIKKAADGEGYRKWVNNLFGGAEEKSGIRNSKDAYTASGNRRSFEALHWETNLENIVNAMLEQDETGGGLFSGTGIWGVSAKKYKSISEVKNDSSRLRTMNEAEYNALKEQYGARMQEIAQTLIDPKNDNYFIASDDAYSLIVDAVRNSKDESGILRYLKKYNSRATEKTASDIAALVRDIAEMPTGYFEAKPQRAVGFDEVRAVILPDNASGELISRLENGGINTVTYKAGDENSRLEALNGVRDVRFSLTRANDEYMKAVESGNVEEQQRLVDEAAENAGYDTVLYHGTQNFGFTQIDVGKYSDDEVSFFATSDPVVAKTYSGIHGYRPIGAPIKNVRGMTDQEIIKLMNSGAADSGDDARYFLLNENKIKEIRSFVDSTVEELRKNASANPDGNEVSREILDARTPDEVAAAVEKAIIRDIDIGVDKSRLVLFGNLQNILSNLEERRMYPELFTKDKGKGELVGRYVSGSRSTGSVRPIGSLRQKLERIEVMESGKYGEDYTKARSGNYRLRARTDGLWKIKGYGSSWDGFVAKTILSSIKDAGQKAEAEHFLDKYIRGKYEEDPYSESGYSTYYSTRDIAKLAKKLGFRGVVLEDISDIGNFLDVTSNSKLSEILKQRGRESDVYIFFNPEQDVKSADPITYDDSGNVIPLTERFDSGNRDIRWSLSGTTDGRPVAVIDKDILDGVPESEWKSVARKAISEGFPDGIAVQGKNIRVNQTTRREYTKSDYTQWLFNHSKGVFADKMRAAAKLDDVVLAATNWTKDGGLKHPRKDNFADFGRGNVLMSIGGNKYSAEVILAYPQVGAPVLYDVVTLNPDSFDLINEKAASANANAATSGAHTTRFSSDISAPNTVSLTQNAPDVNSQYTHEGEKDSSGERHSLVKSAQSELKALQKENEKLRQNVDDAKQELQLTHGRKLSRDALISSIQKILIDRYDVKLSAKELYPHVTNLYDMFYNNTVDGKRLKKGERVDTMRIIEEMDRIVDTVIENAVGVDDTYVEMKNLLPELRKTKLVVPMDARADAAQSAGFENWAEIAIYDQCA